MNFNPRNEGRTFRGLKGTAPPPFDKPSVKIKMVGKMIIIVDKDTLVSKIILIIISSYKVSLLVKMVSATLL